LNVGFDYYDANFASSAQHLGDRYFVNGTLRVGR